MTREEISKAAIDYADVTKSYLLSEEVELVRNAYEAGAEWAYLHQQTLGTPLLTGIGRSG